MEQTFWQAHGNEVSAAIALGASIVIAVAVDRLLFGSAEKAASKVDTAVFSREARTRLRLLRRLLFVVIIGIGVALALSQFADVRRLATGVLASTALLGLIIGFAARQVLANAVAGVILAITQPVRIGDLVTIEDTDGRVADITLTYTEIDGEDGRRIMVPNEMLTTTVVSNRSVGGARAPAVAMLGVPPTIDMDAARKAIEAAGARSVTLSELDHDSARLEVKADRDVGKARAAQESELREIVQSALRSAGLLAEPVR
jgi:small-conductance mechanosensitive channel